MLIEPLNTPIVLVDLKLWVLKDNIVA
jgi:hypothetical protein